MIEIDPSESGYRRGFHQAVATTLDRIAAKRHQDGGVVLTKADMEELFQWEENIRAWREGRTESFTPPEK